MITVEQQRDWAQQLVADSAAGTASVQPDWLGAARSTAVQALTSLPLLNRKLEGWRYSRIDALLEHHFVPPAAAPAVPAAALND